MKQLAIVVAMAAAAACGIPVPLDISPARPEHLVPETPLDGIDVQLEPAGTSAWFVSVENRRDEQIDLVWDESSYITGNNATSAGRLVRGNTRVFDAGKTQPASPIARHARIREFCIAEHFITFVPTLQQQVPAALASGQGRIVLVFATSHGRETWEGALGLNGATPRITPSSSSPPDAGVDAHFSPAPDNEEPPRR